jgi:hypothetical protein
MKNEKNEQESEMKAGKNEIFSLPEGFFFF